MILKITEAGNLGAISIFETELAPPKYRNPKQNSSTLAQQRKMIGKGYKNKFI